MKYTENLGLPIYDSPDTDLFKLNDWNNGNQKIEDEVNKINSSLADIEGITTLKEDKMFTLKEDYTSVITNNKIKDYSYDNLQTDINLIVSKYVGKVEKELIGKSVLDREINALILGNKNGANKLLVFSGHHAREQHMASVILKQIEYYCENWNKKVNGETLESIFEDSAIFFIPSINPDGLELCRIGIDSIPQNYADREVLINNIKQALETKIKTNLLKNRDITENTDLPVIWVGEKGTVPNYTFRNKDMHMWKANANGVDLHYNCWEEGYNGEYVKNWANTNGYDTGFASENYIGAIGMGEPENIALKNFIEKYNLKTYTLSYHGKGPTNFWNYEQTGLQLRRTYKMMEELSQISRTPNSESRNSKVGFAGYMYSLNTTQNYLVTSMVRETGWGNELRNKNNNYIDINSPFTVCPLPDNQLPWIWESEKHIPLYILSKYVRRQDIIERDYNISALEYQSKVGTLGYIKTPTEGDKQIIEQWGTTTAKFENNTVVMLTIPFQIPFKSYNFGTFANCFNNIAENKLVINCSKELNQVVIRIVSPEPLTKTVNINWFAKGV
jgi:murein tripeptide amidase MpaA